MSFTNCHVSSLPLTTPLKVALNPNGVVRCAYPSGAGRTATYSDTTTNKHFSCPTPTRSAASEYGAARAAGSGQVSGSDAYPFNVVIVGAGIIGLTIARQFLLGSNLSVALVDAAVPCAGATGAGQGYIWRVHKTPGTEKWELAMRSHNLWEAMAESVQNQGMDPLLTLVGRRQVKLITESRHGPFRVLEEIEILYFV